MPFIEIDTFTLLTTIFWVWMMVDCLFNKRVKLFWFLFILFTHIFGAVIYYIFACSHRNPVDALAYYIQRLTGITKPKKPKSSAYKPPRPRYQPQRPAQTYTYTPYQQGYQPQPSQAYQPPTSTAPAAVYEPPQEAYTPQMEYEQPTTTYPEMPPQQMN